jgi:Immunity protein 53
MDALTKLQQWYRSRCDGDWEHSLGITIGTLDNPGWSFDVDLRDTPLEGKSFKEHSYGVGSGATTSGDDWLVCKVEQHVFKGRGGPFKLQEMIEVFLDWTERNS